MNRKIQSVVSIASVVLVCGGVGRAQLLPEKTAKPPKPSGSKAKPSAPIIRIVEPEVVLIKAGEFRMGSEGGEEEDERPVHRVYVSDFYIAKYPVDNTEYKRFVDATGHRAPAPKEGGRPLWTGRTFPQEIARQPVVNVSWDDAVGYCRWLSQSTGKIYRLPTEAEWEKAARGGLDQKKYPWGDDAPDSRKAWFGQKWLGLQTLRDKGYGIANGYGLLGVAGNVAQWVGDLYNRHNYSRSSPRDPEGPFGGFDRVVRGGSVFQDANRIRCAARDFRPPTDRVLDVGFRVVRQ